jgi:hypothetical protein
MGKFPQYAQYAQYANIVIVGSAGVSMVVGEQHLHIHHDGPEWPDSVFGVRVATAVTTTGTTTSFLGTSSCQR